MFDIHLSLAQVGQREIDYVVAALTSGWVAPAGPDLDAFEKELAAAVGVDHVVGLASGTAAIHLGLKGLRVQPGDEVIVPTLTFAATAFAVVHAGAQPVFVDVDHAAWGLDPELLDEALTDRARRGKKCKVVMPVDLLGRPADHASIAEVCEHHHAHVFVDAAESIGATYEGKPTGGQGVASVLSFNGNKIITSAGGGALATNDPRLADKVRYWSTQSREPLPWYEHTEIGYNYRLSNILAALGRAQLTRLDEIVARRRAISALYESVLGAAPGISMLTDPPWGHGNAWLSCAVFDAEVWPGAAERVRVALARQGIEARRVWKPMHRQPVFANAPVYLTGVADTAFDSGLCLPSGVGLSDEEIRFIADTVLRALDA